MARLNSAIKRHVDRGIAAEGTWLTGVPAIVADNNDPDRQHRVRVIIPSIDENEIFDEWARQMVFCMGKGFGSAFIPPKGSEVVLFGQLGQKFNLFYASLYNEEMTLPGEFNSTTAGVHVPGNLKLIAEQLAQLKGTNLEAIAGQLAKIIGAEVEVTADGKVKVAGSTIEFNGDSIKIQGGSVQITGSSIKLHGRTVNQAGPSI